MSVSEIAQLRVVTFEETGDTREVLRDCASCLRAGEHYGCAVISPSGIAHIGCDGGNTLCGKDATGDAWWWPL